MIPITFPRERPAERSEEQERQDRRGLRTWVDEDGIIVEGADPATAGDPADLGASHYPHADEAVPSGLDEPSSDLAACPRAGFWSRAGALALDILLVGIGGALLGAEDGWGFALIVACHVGFWAWKGTTIGGIVCHVRVVRAER